jgi:hypothetical protein
VRLLKLNGKRTGEKRRTGEAAAQKVKNKPKLPRVQAAHKDLVSDNAEV